MNLELIKVNWRLANLFLQGRQIETSDFLRSYEMLADLYDDEWYRHLDSVTTDVFKNLEGLNPKFILDLGCGTGSSTLKLKGMFSDAHITGVDFSKKMLKCSRKKLGDEKVLLFRESIEGASTKFCDDQFDLILCAWSLGYARNKDVYRNLHRILKKNGHLLILTNKEDTLKAVKAAMKYTMFKHSDRIDKAPLHKFPKDKEDMLSKLGKGFNMVKFEEGSFNIDFKSKPSVVKWLLNTGILAGYEFILDLRRSIECQKTYDEYIKSHFNEITHNYMWMLLSKI